MRLISCFLLTLVSTVVALAPQSVRNALSRRSFVSTVAVSPVVAAAAAEAAELPQTGAKAPAFDLPNSRGNGTTSLSQLVDTGKWTVLYFYPGAFTQGCTLEARYFQRDIEE